MNQIDDKIDYARQRVYKNAHDSTKSNWHTYVIAGAVSGAAGKSVVAPLEYVKLSFQIQEHPIRKDSPGRFCGIRSAFKIIYHENGFNTFWKGNMASCLRIIPYSAVKFSVFEVFPRPMSGPSERIHLLAGAVAGVAAVSATYPLAVIQTQIMTASANAPKAPVDRISVLAHPRYDFRISKMAATILQRDGLRGFFRGFVPTIIGVIPFEGLQFMAYQAMKAEVVSALCDSGAWPWEPSSHVKKEDVRLKPLHHLLLGLLAGGFAQSVTYPLDVVRKRMQVQPLLHQEVQFRGMMDCILKIAQTEGIRGFYKGRMLARFINLPQAAVTWMAYEQVKEWLDKG